MKIYRWNSEVFAQYASGDILAIGDTVEAARDAARAGFKEAATERWEWLFPKEGGLELDEDDIAERDKKVALFEKDIAGEPEIGDAFIINGSE